MRCTRCSADNSAGMRFYEKPLARDQTRMRVSRSLASQEIFDQRVF
jgi:hypothetical protein